MANVQFDRQYEALGKVPLSAKMCHAFNYAELADIYNQTRIDYIVPMPMNDKRMEEYITHYNIDLKISPVIYNASNELAGIGMLGVRDKRGWVTRLGVIPNKRNHKVGQYMMETLLKNALDHNLELLQLEVIKGNVPAHRLFQKIGFEETRELLVIRRPPSEANNLTTLKIKDIRRLNEKEIKDYLCRLDIQLAWTEEAISLLNTKSLQGIELETDGGKKGWVICQVTPFKLKHITLMPSASLEMMTTLLYHLHKSFPALDTKVENVPTESLRWQAYQAMGYVEEFSRIEMYLYLN